MWPTTLWCVDANQLSASSDSGADVGPKAFYLIFPSPLAKTDPAEKKVVSGSNTVSCLNNKLTLKQHLAASNVPNSSERPRSPQATAQHQA